MTDLEMTRLCAEAMGLEYRMTDESVGISPYGKKLKSYHSFLLAYDPLHDDEQAMELVKRFRLEIAWSRAGWVSVEAPPRDDKPITHTYKKVYLNRAIVECVAKMQGMGAK